MTKMANDKTADKNRTWHANLIGHPIIQLLTSPSLLRFFSSAACASSVAFDGVGEDNGEANPSKEQNILGLI